MNKNMFFLESSYFFKLLMWARVISYTYSFATVSIRIEGTLYDPVFWGFFLQFLSVKVVIYIHFMQPSQFSVWYFCIIMFLFNSFYMQLYSVMPFSYCAYYFSVLSNIQKPLYNKSTMEQKYITVCVLFVLFCSPVQGNILQILVDYNCLSNCSD